MEGVNSELIIVIDYNYIVEVEEGVYIYTEPGDRREGQGSDKTMLIIVIGEQCKGVLIT